MTQVAVASCWRPGVTRNMHLPPKRRPKRVRLTVAVPGRSGACQSKLASCRPLPLAQVAPPAPGGAPIAPYLLRYAQSVNWQTANPEH